MIKFLKLILVVFFLSVQAKAAFTVEKLKTKEVVSVNQLGLSNKKGVLLVDNKGRLFQLKPFVYLLDDVSSNIAPVGKDNVIAFADKNNYFNLFKNNQRYRSKIKLAPNSGILVLDFAYIAIVEHNKKFVLARIELLDSRLFISAMTDFEVLPDFKPIQTDLINNGDSGHIAVLAKPSKRYSHGVLGDNIEATELHYLERHSLKSLVKPLVLSKEVFEANALNAFSLFGKNYLIATISGNGKGAMTGLISVEDNRLQIIASSKPLKEYRWQSPFVFDGKIYSVQMPHIAGFLVQYNLNGKKLDRLNLGSGFSNHKIGSRETNLVASTPIFALIPMAGYRKVSILARGNLIYNLPNKLPSDIVKAVAYENDVYLLLDNGNIYLVFLNAGQ